MIKNVQVIVNPASGQPQPVLRTLNNAFREADIAWDVSITKSPGDARLFAQQAATTEVDAVAVYGGDGSVMEAASGLLGSDVPLAILPGGTANAMAGELGIPKSLDKACRLIGNGSSAVQPIDVGRSADRYFVLRIGVGQSAEEVKGANRELKDSLGFLAYWVSSIRSLREPKISRYVLDLDGEQVEIDGLSCIIANSGNLGLPGLSLASDIKVNDGLLDVLVIRNADLDSFVSLVGSMADVKATALTMPHWKAREVSLLAYPPQGVQGDGELWGETPVSAKVLHQAVRVIVPGATTEKPGLA